MLAELAGSHWSEPLYNSNCDPSYVLQLEVCHVIFAVSGTFFRRSAMAVTLLVNSDSLMSGRLCCRPQATHNEQDGLVLVVVVAVTNAASICCNGSKVLYDFLL